MRDLKIFRRLLAFLHRRCKHDSRNVSADLNQGSYDSPILWCRTCGAGKRSGYWELAVDPFLPG